MEDGFYLELKVLFNRMDLKHNPFFFLLIVMNIKPFIKWAGGKSQLIEEIESRLPKQFKEREDITYIEPFVGGGAVLFYLLTHYHNIKKAIINDINFDLINCFNIVKNEPQKLITKLRYYEHIYNSFDNEGWRKEYYLANRDLYNDLEFDPIEEAALFIFLNKTCFNGLYRVNKNGKFNVPFGRYQDPNICDEEKILYCSKLLQNVTILCDDFEKTLSCAEGYTFFYLDPPFRPISNTSHFNNYNSIDFDDKEQIRLKFFCDTINESHCDFLLSNSDSEENSFFDELYNNYKIERVLSRRNINSDGARRGKINELLIRNYE